MHGLFITGTATGTGKTVVAAAICAALTARGERVAAYKPVVTGLDEPDATWPMDHELLAACAQSTAGAVTARTFGPPLSPHRAAELAGRPLDPAVLVADARRAAAAGDVLVAEGVGGLLVPLTLGYLVRDLAVDLGMPVVIAARPGLGTINHTLLTVQAARAAGLRVAGVAMGPWPGDPVARRARPTCGRSRHSATWPSAPCRSSRAPTSRTSPRPGRPCRWTSGSRRASSGRGRGDRAG